LSDVSRPLAGIFVCSISRASSRVRSARCCSATSGQGWFKIGPLEALTWETARALDAVISAAGVKFVASPIRLGEPASVRFPPKLDEQGDALRLEFGLPARPVVPRSASDEKLLR
jgi:hypothetical protein